MGRLSSSETFARAGRSLPIRIGARAIREFGKDNCPHLAAAIAYHAIFSLFPLLLSVISIIGFVIEASPIQARLIDGIASMVPSSAGFVSETINRLVAARMSVGLVAVIGMLWSAMSVFSAIRWSLNLVWKVPTQRSVLHQKLLDLAMVLSVAVLVLLSVMITAALPILRSAEVPLLGLKPFDHEFLWSTVAALLAVSLDFIVFLLVYRIVPNTAVLWREAALGALVASPMFELAKNFLAWYVQNIGRYELVYGSVGVAMGFLMWVYVSALVLLFGAEVASEYARLTREQPRR